MSVRRTVPLIAALTVALALSCAACGSDDDAPSSSTTTSTTVLGPEGGTPAATNTAAHPPTTVTATTATTTNPQQTAAAANLARQVTTGPCEAAATLPAVQVDSATTSGADVKLSGHRAQLQCGGMSDSHYSVGTDIVAVTIPGTMTVSTVELTVDGITSKQRLASELPAYLPTDNTGHWFVFEGGYDHPTGVAERFQA
jgi:hypothetical protein